MADFLAQMPIVDIEGYQLHGPEAPAYLWGTRITRQPTSLQSASGAMATMTTGTAANWQGGVQGADAGPVPQGLGTARSDAAAESCSDTDGYAAFRSPPQRVSRFTSRNFTWQIPSDVWNNDESSPTPAPRVLAARRECESSSDSDAEVDHILTQLYGPQYLIDRNRQVAAWLAEPRNWRAEGDVERNRRIAAWLADRSNWPDEISSGTGDTDDGVAAVIAAGPSDAVPGATAAGAANYPSAAACSEGIKGLQAPSALDAVPFHGSTGLRGQLIEHSNAGSATQTGAQNPSVTGLPNDDADPFCLIGSPFASSPRPFVDVAAAGPPVLVSNDSEAALDADEDVPEGQRSESHRHLGY